MLKQPGSLTLPEIDSLQYRMAEMNGQPLPDVEMSPALAALKARIEEYFGVRVLVRPHRFGMLLSTGSVSLADRIVTLLVHPDLPEEESRRSLYHEAGHLLQQGTHDRASIAGYIECEEEANEKAWALATEWGDGALFPDTVRQEWRAETRAQEDLLWALSSIAGTEDPSILVPLASRLRLGVDREIGQSLFGEGEEGCLSYARLAEIACRSPEKLIGFDRSILRGAWRITTWGPPAEPLVVTDREAAHRLVVVMGSLHRREHAPSNRYSPQLVHEGAGVQPTITIWCDEVATFMALVQPLIVRDPRDASMALTWSVTITAEASVYEAHLELSNCKFWRVFCQFGPHRGQTVVQEALKLFINSFRHVAGIYPRDMADTLRHIAWLWSRSSGPVPRTWDGRGLVSVSSW